MSVIKSCIDILDCMRAEEIRMAILDNENTCMLSELVFQGWPSMKAEVQKDLQSHWSFIDEIMVIDRSEMKCNRMIIPAALQGRAIKQVYLKCMGIQKT